MVAAADVAQGTFYMYFDSKESVFAEVAQQVIDAMMDDLHVEYVSGRGFSTAPSDRDTAGRPSPGRAGRRNGRGSRPPPSRAAPRR
ncbi:TetR family transcriptional regulator [Streptomyces chartreusis]|uniref:TetR family transcriptional regulator n=1 Tax=Streptomyces chartreusis TaxID=1969 RepID=UPI003639FB8A